MDQHSAALERAHRHTLDWLSSLEHRPVPPQASIDQVTDWLVSAWDQNCALRLVTPLSPLAWTASRARP